MGVSSPIVLFLPAHDEAEAVGGVVGRVPAEVLGHPVRCVVVDDGSRDDSAAVLAAIPGVRPLRQENRGVAAARNAGVAASTSPFLAFLDQDDVWAPEKLARQLAALEADPGAGFCLAHQVLRLAPGVT